MRLHVDHGDAIEARKLLGADDFHLDIQQVLHPQVLGARGALKGRDHRSLLRAAQHVAQREPAGHGVRVRVVVQQNQHAIRIAEEPLILLDLQPRQRSAEFDEQRLPEEVRNRKIVDLGKKDAQFLLVLVRVAAADADDVHERRPRVADGFERLAQAPFAGVFNDDAGGGGDVGFEVGVGAARVARQDVQVRVMELPGERLALDEKFDFEAGLQGFVEHPDEQLGLTDGETPHSI